VALGAARGAVSTPLRTASLSLACEVRGPGGFVPQAPCYPLVAASTLRLLARLLRRM